MKRTKSSTRTGSALEVEIQFQAYTGDTGFNTLAFRRNPKLQFFLAVSKFGDDQVNQAGAKLVTVKEALEWYCKVDGQAVRCKIPVATCGTITNLAAAAAAELPKPAPELEEICSYQMAETEHCLYRDARGKLFIKWDHSESEAEPIDEARAIKDWLNGVVEERFGRRVWRLVKRGIHAQK